MADLEGQEFYGEYLGKTDPLGADVPNPVSHIAYGYATQLCVLDKDTGRIKRMVAAHDVGKAVNPLSVEGQIEGGVVMSMGYALTERYPMEENCRPTVKFGTWACSGPTRSRRSSLSSWKTGIERRRRGHRHR